MYRQNRARQKKEAEVGLEPMQLATKKYPGDLHFGGIRLHNKCQLALFFKVIAGKLEN